MDRYVLFVNTATDYIAYPLKSFVGAYYNSSTTVDLYFEKAPLSYKIRLNIEAGSGVSVTKKILELFSKYSGSVIAFDEPAGKFPIKEISGIASLTKVVIK
tara:strand:+ start:391 stop:693 length:303 start_codon:yes stop_codon:yes gene_type:complete